MLCLCVKLLTIIDFTGNFCIKFFAMLKCQLSYYDVSRNAIIRCYEMLWVNVKICYVFVSILSSESIDFK